MPVPFACSYDDGRASVRTLNGSRVTQCALSRICGVCGQGLDQSSVFVGTQQEQARNAFHFPPSHAACARSPRASLHDAGIPVPGQDEVTTVVSVTGPGFEFVRPTREDVDRRPVFVPHLPAA